MNMYIPPALPDEPDQPGSVQSNQPSSDDTAVNAIREKLSRLYTEEPDAKQELQEASTNKPHSKHQRFMHELSDSGKDIATIQTEWHNYYQSLPDHEKHQVWHEFYQNQQTKQLSVPTTAPKTVAPDPQQLASHKHETLAAKTKHRAVSRAKKTPG